MFTNDPLDALFIAHEHGRELRAEAEAHRLGGSSGTRRTLATYLRRAADRLDRAPLVRTPASQP